MIDLDAFPYIPAYYRHPRSEPIRVIVMHDTQGGSARANAQFFASKEALDKANSVGSAHYIVGSTETIRCAQDNEVCNGAAGANEDGLHVELAESYADFTAEDWAAKGDLLERAAQLVAALCHLHQVPAVRLETTTVAAHDRGILGHDLVSATFHESTHTDPGPHFPWVQFISRINVILQEEADVPLSSYDLEQIDQRFEAALRRVLFEGVPKDGPKTVRDLLADRDEVGTRRAIKKTYQA